MRSRGGQPAAAVDKPSAGGPPAGSDMTVTAASLNLTKNLVGAGIFSLPIALYRGSVVLGLLVMIVVGLLCGSSFVLIAFLCKRLNCQTYREVWCAAFGKRSAFVIDSSILLNGVTACISYVILIADFQQKAVEGLFGWEGASRSLLIWGNTAFLLLPLAHARDLSKLRYTSIMGLAIIALVFAYVLSDFAANWPAARANLQESGFHADLGIFSTLAICTGAFKAHYNAPKFYKELGCNLTAHSHMVLASYIAAFFIYSSFAMAGLGLFGEGVLGNCLRNYSSEGNMPILLAWLGMAFAIIFTYPLVFTSSRDSLVGSMPALQRALRRNPTKAHVAVTSSLVFFISAVGTMVDDVSVVTALLGATIGSCLCWIFPAMIYLKASRSPVLKDAEVPLLNASTMAGPKLEPHGLLIGYSVFIIVTGFLSMIVSICGVMGLF